VLPLISREWFNVGRIGWLPDGSGVLFDASEGTADYPTQVWLRRYNPVKPSGVRISAWKTLADIYLLTARNIEDLRTGIGWTEDELDYANRTGMVPPRIAALIGYSTLEDLAAGKTLRNEKLTRKPS
jgi:hypothetical protein